MFEAVISAYRWFFLQLAGVVGLGWGIVLLSVICSLLMIPLMRLVAGVVKREADYQSVILPQLSDIKSRYESDVDRHLHIQRLYRRYGYSPISAVKKVLPLFVQIPFLFLTYFMLKDTVELRGVSFLFLKDLGQPDALMTTFNVNVLPIVMTFVNIVTVFATPGFTSRDWTQAIGISLLFLVLLYTAPSALLLYWTLNNVITMVRTFVNDRAAGARLLVGRIVGLKNLPSVIRQRMTEQALGVIGMVTFLLALYLRLMVLAEVWFFNYMAGYWFMVEVLAVSIGINYLLLRRQSRLVRGVSQVGMWVSTIAAVCILAALCSILFTQKVMMFMTQKVKLTIVFDLFLIVWVLPVLMDAGRRLNTVWQSLKTAFSREWHWLVAVCILTIHYSFASANFKLPFDSVLVLGVYMLLPCVILIAFAIVAYHRYCDVSFLFKLVAGVCIGAYLIPMISLEQGKLLGWGSNLLLRLVLMGMVAGALLYLKRAKPVRVFIALLAVIACVNAWMSKHRLSAETDERQEASEGSAAQKAMAALPCVHSNSVYLLLYDGYMHDINLEGMRIKHGEIGKWLRAKGFTRYDAYSTGDGTVASMGAAFAVGDVVQGSDRSMLSGNNAFCDYLRRFGFKTYYVINGYEMPKRGERTPGDYYFPSPQEITRPEMVLFPCIVKGILSQSANTFNEYTEEEWQAEKLEVFRKMGANGSFIYAHSHVPGHVISNPVYRKSPEIEKAQYEERVAQADAEIRRDVELLLDKNDDAIIIVASDHGSHLSLPEKMGEYDAFTLLDRLGIQLFVRWPHDYKPCLKLHCLKNLFLEVMIYMSGDTSIAKFESQGESLRVMAPLRAPAGTVKNGIIQSGVDKGKNLFEAARERAKQWMEK